jgi:hypothetical protein
MTHTVLLLPDIHAKRGDKLERFDALRAWLQRRRVRLDNIILIGDVFDMESLCLHDNQQPEWYSRSLKADLDVGYKALTKVQQLANCPLVFVEGNHEVRYNKWMKSDNRLLTSDFPQTVRDLVKAHNKKIHYVDFLEPYIYHGVAFSHYFVTGLMGRAQGGERPAGNILKAQHMSCVAGHSHLLDFSERTKADGSKLYGLVSGCFVDPEADFAYAGAARKLWWTGCHLLHFTASGEFDVESINIARL